jgi:hypothetical protein
MPEVGFDVEECRFGWRAAYHQDGTRVTVRIKLQPLAGVDAATLDACRSRWKSGIEAAWSDQPACCNIALQVSWVSGDEHLEVGVKLGDGRSNMRLWHTADTGRVAAHEVGHLLGNPDEYEDPICPNRSPINTGSIMHVVSGPVAPRHCTRICEAVS